MKILAGDEELAETVFEELDWQHPESLLEDWKANGEIAWCPHCAVYVPVSYTHLFKEYENAKGNGHMHTVVQPEMRALEVIPMHEDAKIAELMGSRK